MKNIIIISAVLVLCSCNNIGPNINNINYDKTDIVSNGTPGTSEKQVLENQIISTDFNDNSLDQFSENESWINRDFADDWEKIIDIHSYCLDFDGRDGVYLLSTEGLQYFDGKVLQKIMTPEKYDAVRGCPHVDHDGTVYFFSDYYQSSTNIGIFRNENWEFISFPSLDEQYQDRSTSLAMDKNGDFWYSVNNNLGQSQLYRYNDTNWDEYDFEFKKIFSLKSDGNGNIWIGGSRSDGVAKFDGENWNYYSLTSIWEMENGSSQNSTDFTGIFVYPNPDNSIWIISPGESIWVKINNDDSLIRFEAKVDPNISLLSLQTIPSEKIFFIHNGMNFGYYDEIDKLWVRYANMPSYTLSGSSFLVSSPNDEIWLILTIHRDGYAGIYKYIGS